MPRLKMFEKQSLRTRLVHKPYYMGCGGSKPEAEPSKPDLPYDPLDVVVYTCSDSTDDDE